MQYKTVTEAASNQQMKFWDHLWIYVYALKGAKIILRRNLWVSKRLANGTVEKILLLFTIQNNIEGNNYYCENICCGAYSSSLNVLD